jgi:fructose transport system ATP-binding protein
MVTPAIQTVGLSKSYGQVVALDDVDFELQWGEVHAIVGDNGAGKSTFIKSLSGAVQPTSGQIFIAGKLQRFKDPKSALEAGIATVYQDLALVGCRSIEDNLFLGHEITGFAGRLKRREMRRLSRELLSSLRQLNISDTTAKVDRLSGGQRQAVAIARGIRLSTRVLILDEPTAALGVGESHKILDVIAGFRSDDRTILIVSHNLAHVFRLADRISVFRGGSRVGTVEKDAASPDDIVRMITGAEAL